MLVRIIETTDKPGKRTEIMALLNEELPFIRRQPGFVDAMALTDQTNPDERITLAFWATRDDLERYYGSPEFQAETKRFMSLVEKVTMHTCTVDVSTFHKIAAVMAA